MIVVGALLVAAVGIALWRKDLRSPETAFWVVSAKARPVRPPSR
jgi:hypothetical protein